MKNIVIIGGGQLGSRHLQGLSLLNGISNIFVIDPSEDALKVAQKRLDEVPEKIKGNHYFYFNDYKDLPNSIDLAIIATNSDVRKKVLVQLISKFSVKSLVLEKFLFQIESDFYEIKKIVSEQKIKAWVNCPRRIYPDYIKLKKYLNNTKIIEFNIYGSAWSLASNSIHMIDLFAYLTNCTNYTFSKINLLPELFENKRKGFIEFNGIIHGGFVNGPIFRICSYPAGNENLIIEVITDNSIIKIDESKKKIVKQQKKDFCWEILTEEFNICYQSQLTQIVADQILAKNYCALPSINEAIKLHIPLFNIFLNHLKIIKNDMSINLCPIT